MGERQIEISAGDVIVTAVLNDSDTADELWAALPITARAQTWGDEIYFSIPVNVEEAADSQETVEMGAVAYWPPGSALCLFWGPTPTSAPGEIRPASAVNVMGLIDGDPTVLGGVADGTEVVVARMGE
ncbi:MAG: cyclophilin-like fold protein [Dehalococcoidia bacterium]|nr:cyclophilin-like fold protein [Dehalococcoidia bacterium]